LLNLLLWTWFALTAVSVAYIGYDAFARTPSMKVMKWGWVLVALYTGPVALIVYWMSCREPAPGTHERFVAPRWKQTVGSTIHCLAGDATGVIFGAIVTNRLRLPMGIDVIAEYATGFAFGLLIFQALFMKDMLGGTYTEAVRRTLLPEWLSMNAVMAGMIPAMVILMSRDMRAMEPTSPLFWASMSAASLAGAVVAYPVNWWLVAKGLKHGMGTERAVGKGGERLGQRSDHQPHASEGMQPRGDQHRSPSGSHALGTATRAEKALVSLLTIAALSTGAFIGGEYGDWSMRPQREQPAGYEHARREYHNVVFFV
jgi:Domain of unknown function (DUF4396)